MTDMKHESFRVTYDGQALISHEIDVRVLAPALLAVGDLLEHANRVINDSKTKVAVNVKGSLKTGSVNIDFAIVQGFVSQAIDLLSGKEATAASVLLTFLGFSAKDGFNSVIKVIKWIRGRTIRKVEILESAAQIFVDDEMIEVELAVLELLRDYELRRSIEAVLDPLEKEGIDTFAVGTDSTIHESITKIERKWFDAPPPASVDLEVNTYQKSVQIERIEFSESNKWRFFDGSGSFYATIIDTEFLNMIAMNEAAFSRGDTLRVEIEERQRLEGDKLKSEYIITRVMEHRRGMRQISLGIE